MVGYVIVPGIGGSDDEHWQTLWQRQWGAAAARIRPQSWSQPDLGDWVDAIDRAVKEVEARADDVVLVAHSLGCWAASAWLGEAGIRPPRGTLLVAPPDPAGERFPGEAAPTFVDVLPHPLPCPSVVVASANDPYCRLEVARDLATSWGSRFEPVGSLGHLNSGSGLGDWPQGRGLLTRLTSRGASPTSPA